MPRATVFWSEEEIEFLKKNYLKLGPTGCAKFLPDKGRDRISRFAKNIGLSAIAESSKQRFELCLRITPSCWLWEKGKDADGYGQFYFEGSNQRAHRVSYQLYVGALPSGLCVCHRCDNPSCVNPDHLFLGTIGDNNIDRHKKGRSPKGESIGRSKLTSEQVLEIKASASTAKEMAEKFEVTAATIRKIRNRKLWKHVNP
jgi:hypothetical protein